MQCSGKTRRASKRTREEARVRRLLRHVVNDAIAAGMPVALGNLAEAKLCHRRNDIAVCRRTQCADGVVYTICFSDYYLALSDDDVLDVLMHEVIHTLPNCWDHNERFRGWMRLINATMTTGHRYHVVVSSIGDDARRLHRLCEAALTLDHPHMVNVGCDHGCVIAVSCRSKVARHPELFECREHQCTLRLVND